MKITIRNEKEEERFLVEKITRDAFWNLYTPGCNEHFLIHKLRNHKDFIPELCFVLERAGEVIGSIFYSHSKVVDLDGTEYKTITFGPVSIRPDFHRQGFGRMLISHSIEQAKLQDYGAIIIGGFPYHYKPYGFVGAKKYNIALEDGNYYTGIMALPLKDNYLDDIKKGVVYFSEALEPGESGLDIFDAKFPQLKKEVKECQGVFEQAVAEIDKMDY